MVGLVASTVGDRAKIAKGITGSKGKVRVSPVCQPKPPNCNNRG